MAETRNAISTSVRTTFVTGTTGTLGGGTKFMRGVNCTGVDMLDNCNVVNCEIRKRLISGGLAFLVSNGCCRNVISCRGNMVVCPGCCDRSARSSRSSRNFGPGTNNKSGSWSRWDGY